MTKKRFLIAIAIVMVLILSVAVFVACNENQTKSYTVKFVDGESEVKSVSVEEGKTIADADIPADLTKDGYVFEGWYVGDVAFDKSAAITADVTYSAKWTKLHTVKFVDGNETIKTATVKDGEKLKDADVPADLTATGKAFEGWFDGTTAFDKDATITADKTFAAKWVGLFNVTFMNGDTQVKSVKVKSGEKIADADIPVDPAFATPEYAFGGWFNGEVEFNEDATVDSNVVYTAKWNKVAYVVTFKNGDEVVKTSYIEIAEGAKLTAEDLADAATKAGSVFLGYYDGIVKAAADLQVTADRTFVAEFANEQTYAAGYWINTDEHKMLTIKSDKKVTYDKLSNKAFKYDAKTGTMKYSDGFGYDKVNYTITVIGDHAIMTESGFDYKEDPYSKDTILEKKADAGLAAFYTMGRNKQFIVEDNGIISGYGSNAFKYGWFYTETVDGKTVYHFDFIVSTTLVQKTATVDANGNYVVTGSGEASYNGIYGKDVDGITYYGDSQYIYGLVGETSTTYVYVDANKDSHYATISGELAANSIITVSYGEGKSVVFTITKVAKATADGSFKQASSERGTYNGDKGAIFLDGFGKATVDGAAYSYYINGANVVVLSNETATIGVTIDTEIGVYLEKTTDGKAQIFTQSGSTYYTFELDGFGGVNYIYKSSYSTSITRGTYEFSQDGATVTIAKVNSDVNGTYNIQDSGKVLVESTSERKVFIAKGYTVTTHEQEFVGYYVDAKGKAIEITIEDGRIWLAIAGTNKRLTKNWNGTVLSYSAKDDDAAEGYTNIYSDYTLTLVDGNVVISHGCVTGYDSSYEEYLREPKSVTYTKTEKPFAFPESARGTWYLDDNTVVVIAEKSITVGGVEGADYNVTESMFGTNYEFSIGGKKYMVYEDAVTAGKWYYCAADSHDAIELSKTEHAATLDAFAGTWKWNSLTFTFDGKGNVTVIGAYDGTYTYTVDAAGTTATFRNTAYSEDITCKLNSDGAMTVNDQSSEWINNAKFAKEETTTGGAAVTADMQGTYTGTNGYTTNYTLIVGENSIVYKEVDSSWGVNINDTITDYTISEDGYTITWTKSGTTYKFMDTGFAYKLYVGTDDYTLTKQA